MSDDGLTPAEHDQLFEVFRRHPEIIEVRIFGSRAKGDHRPNSDIDLALWGNVDITLLAHIAQELDDLPLPYTFDVTAYETIRHSDLKKHIDRVGRLFYSRETSGTMKSGTSPR